MIVQAGARECLYSSQNKPTQKLEAVLERCNIPFQKRRLTDFKLDNIDQDLGRLLGDIQTALGKEDVV